MIEETEEPRPRPGGRFARPRRRRRAGRPPPRAPAHDVAVDQEEAREPVQVDERSSLWSRPRPRALVLRSPARSGAPARPGTPRERLDRAAALAPLEVREAVAQVRVRSKRRQRSATSSVLATASGRSRSAPPSRRDARWKSAFGRRSPCEPSSVARFRIATSTSWSRCRSGGGSGRCRSPRPADGPSASASAPSARHARPSPFTRLSWSSTKTPPAERAPQPARERLASATLALERGEERAPPAAGQQDQPLRRARDSSSAPSGRGGSARGLSMCAR
jgi:hypothetical protein